MAYTPQDESKPSGADTGAAFATSANANDNALRDAVIAGGMLKNYEFSVSGGTASQPAYFYLKKNGGAIWLRGTPTWGSGAGKDGNIISMAWDLSINSGSDYTTAPGGSIGTSTLTFDTSGNLSSATGVAGFAAWIWGLMGKVYKVVSDVATHVALNGTGAHGLGTMSTQNASSVAIAGGSAALTYEREGINAIGNVAGTQNISWTGAGLYSLTVTNAAANLTWGSLPNGVVGFLTIVVTNGAIATSLLGSYQKSGGTAVSWTNPGKDIITLMCYDGSTVICVGFAKDVRT